MKITLEPTKDQSKNEPTMNYPIVTIEIPDDDLGIDDVLEMLINPALIAWGYSCADVIQNREDSP